MRLRPRSTAADAPVVADTSSAAPDATDSRPRPLLVALNQPLAAGFLLTIGGLLAFALGTAFTHLSTILIYVAFAIFAALGLDPVVGWFVKRQVSRGWAIVIVYTLFALVLVGTLLLVLPSTITQIAQFVRDVPKLLTDFQASPAYAWLQQNLGDQVSSLITQAQTFLTTPANLATIGKGVLQAGTTVVSVTSGIIIVLVLSLYFLASMPTIKRSLVRVFPARNRAQAGALTAQIADSVGGYLMGMVILAFCNAVVAFILHLALGLPFPMLMAVAAFCITLIPLIGSVLYLGIATVLALFTGWLPALIFAAIYLVYMQIEAYVLTPKVMNRAISVPGALVVIGALVGGTLLGLLGALIAIPVTASTLLIAKQLFIPRQDAKI